MFENPVGDDISESSQFWLDRVTSAAIKRRLSRANKNRSVLGRLRKHRGKWVRPQDIGGDQFNHIAKTLQRLVVEGKVEKKHRDDDHSGGHNFFYRLPERAKSGRITASNKSPK